jgi:hypothetical protein
MIITIDSNIEEIFALIEKIQGQKVDSNFLDSAKAYYFDRYVSEQCCDKSLATPQPKC